MYGVPGGVYMQQQGNMMMQGQQPHPNMIYGYQQRPMANQV